MTEVKGEDDRVKNEGMRVKDRRKRGMKEESRERARVEGSKETKQEAGGLTKREIREIEREIRE